MRQPREVLAAASRIGATFKELSRRIIGRTKTLEQLMYALVTKQHLFLEGPPGVAKSYLANMLFECIEGAETFHVQCTKKMTEDYLVGPLDMHLFRERGEYLHRVEGYLPTAHYAFLDEFLDLSTGALRALLEVLNERTFSRGPQSVRCPLVTAIACTNFSGESEVALEAVLDRFMFKSKIVGLSRTADRKAMFRVHDKPLPKFSHTDVLRLHWAMKRVTLPEHVLNTYLEVCSQLRLTDRTVRRCIDVVKASAVFRGSTVAALEDLTLLELCFVTTNDSKSEQAFGNSLKKYKEALASRDSMVDASIVARRVSQLAQQLEGVTAADYESKALPIAFEIREAQAALSHLRTQDNAATVQSALSRCEATLNRADTLYLATAKKEK